MTDRSRIGGVMDEPQEEISVCPTFSSYSSDGLAEIAARVTDEFKNESEIAQRNLSVLPEDDDDDFEFSLLPDGPEVFYDGQIRPVFPIFNRDLLVNDGGDDGNKESTSDVVESGEIGIPWKDLFIQEREEEREPPSSSSSSEADELENIPPGTYCVWRPKKVVESSPSCCKKSNSTGSASKRWKFLDLLRRSNSEGKDSYVFLTPKHGEATKKSEQADHSKANKTSGEVAKAERKLKAKSVVSSPSAHETFYVRNREIKQGNKKKSYLPYRQDLVGFFANVNGLSRTYPPF